MPKTDYYADPDAPKANSLVVAVGAVVRNDRGEVLLIERADNGLWALPGGAQEIGESVTDAVRREVREETGIEVEVTGLTGSTPIPPTSSPKTTARSARNSRSALQRGQSQAHCGPAPSRGKHDG